MIAAAAQHGPHIDWAALSPIIALLGGAIVVLLAGLFRARGWCARSLVPLLADRRVRRGDRPRRSGSGTSTKSIVAGALRVDDLAIAMTWIFCVGGRSRRCCCRGASVAPREAAHGEYYALLLTAAAGMVVLAGAQNLVTRLPRATSCCRSRSTCCARPRCAARARSSRA